MSIFDEQIFDSVIFDAGTTWNGFIPTSIGIRYKEYMTASAEGKDHVALSLSSRARLTMIASSQEHLASSASDRGRHVIILTTKGA